MDRVDPEPSSATEGALRTAPAPGSDVESGPEPIIEEEGQRAIEQTSGSRENAAPVSSADLWPGSAPPPPAAKRRNLSTRYGILDAPKPGCATRAGTIPDSPPTNSSKVATQDISSVPLTPRGRYLDPAYYHPRVDEIPGSFAHIVRTYLLGEFMSQFFKLFVICEKSQQRVELVDGRVTCLGSNMEGPIEDLSVQVMRVVAIELYSSDRVRRDIKWVKDLKLEQKGYDTRPLMQDLTGVLREGYVCIFGHELLKNIIQKSEHTLLDFFRKYIDRVEIGRDSIRLMVK